MSELTDAASTALAERANPEFAVSMAAYMKTEMPFYGVKRPELKKMARELKNRFVPADRAEYEANVRALWALPHREEKYLAIMYARAFRAYQDADSLPLFEQMIRQGAWWDFVDDIAANLVGTAWLKDRARVEVEMDRWIADDDLWIRRSAVIGQLKHKDRTDTERLLRYCRIGAPETVFWMRKAIGWALRTHSRHDPQLVRDFLEEMGDRLSGLSRREASKYV